MHGQVLCSHEDPVPAPDGGEDAFKGQVAAKGGRDSLTKVVAANMLS